MRFRKRNLALVILLAAGVVGLSAYALDGVRWRLQAVALKATGDLEPITWGQLINMISPGSDFYMGRLLDTRNPYASLSSPYTGAADLEAGEILYRKNCAHCHEENHSNLGAPDLRIDRLKRGDSDFAIFQTLAQGIDGTSMAPVKLPQVDLWRLVAYINAERLLLRDGATNETTAESVNLTFESIETATYPGQDWPTHHGSYNAQRYTTLAQLDASNLDRLQLAWATQTGATGLLEASPIVVEDRMFVSLTDSVVVALDLATGRELWRYEPTIDNTVLTCCGRVNRGVAVLNGNVFVGTLDGRLVALDSASGKPLWESRVSDPQDGFSITVAPLAVRDMIVIGVSGGEYGIRGYLDAYDAVTGERRWRFYTIPEAGEPGSETWSGDSWMTGGGPTWVTGSYDPVLGLIYWGVGNPSPDFDGSLRAGDNLYTNSVVALHATTGELAWHFQFTPHDLHDLDSNQSPVLVDEVVDGQPRKLMLWANRNGFFYRLDRVSGEFLGAYAFARQTWAVSMEDNGRPVRNPESNPSPKGTLVWPGSSGATNWWPASYDPHNKLFLVAAIERASIFFNHEEGELRAEGQLYLGSVGSLVSSMATSHIVAIDPFGLRTAWKTELSGSEGRISHGGLLTTASNLTIFGEGDRLIVISTDTGEIIKTLPLGGEINAPVVSYERDGQQHVVVTAGGSLFDFVVYPEADQELVHSLDGS